MNYKEITKQSYNEYPREFDLYFQESFDKYSVKFAESFIKKLKGKKILDLGSGSGIHASYFKNKGFDILCIDNSEEMIRLCKGKKLNAQLMDIGNLETDKQETSLL